MIMSNMMVWVLLFLIASETWMWCGILINRYRKNKSKDHLLFALSNFEIWTYFIADLLGCLILVIAMSAKPRDDVVKTMPPEWQYFTQYMYVANAEQEAMFCPEFFVVYADKLTSINSEQYNEIMRHFDSDHASKRFQEFVKEHDLVGEIGVPNSAANP